MTGKVAEQTLMASVDLGLAEIIPVQDYEQLQTAPGRDTVAWSA